MAQAAEHLEQLRAVLTAIGFAKDDLKNADFRVGTEYESVRDADGNCRQVFAGYCVRHQLPGTCPYKPQKFVLRDPGVVAGTLLFSGGRSPIASFSVT